MHECPVHLTRGHLLARIDGADWVVDTGSHASFGDARSIDFGGRTFPLRPAPFGLDALELSRLIGHEVRGLIGADLLAGFDTIIDLPGGRLCVSTDALTLDVETLSLGEFMPVPLLKACIGGEMHTMFFDTGAPFSYLQSDQLNDYPAGETVRDFFPGLGEFDTTLHDLPVRIGRTDIYIRCGPLPDLLGMTLAAAGANGILGNEIVSGRQVGYFPRRDTLCAEPSHQCR